MDPTVNWSIVQVPENEKEDEFTASIKIRPDTHAQLKVFAAQNKLKMQKVADDGVTLQMALIEASKKKPDIFSTLDDLLGRHRTKPKEEKSHGAEATEKGPRRRVTG